MKKEVYLYDFDGTITDNDTFLDIIRFDKGYLRLGIGILLHVHLIVLMKLKTYPNWKTKQIIFSHFFKGMHIDVFNKMCFEYVEYSFSRIIRPKALSYITENNDSPSEHVIVSASIYNWVKPFANKLKIKHVLATEVAVDEDGLITGHFKTKNCYGPEKVVRVSAILNKKDNYHIVAFGDSRGDKEMLSYADKGFFNYFK